MKLQLLTAVAVTALMATPSLANAGEQGWYVRGNVGYGKIADVTLTGDVSGKTDGKGNIAGSVGIGYAFGNNWRLELDGTQLWNDLGALSGTANTSSNMRLTTGMVNALYDFSDFGAFRPYIGAGIGVAQGRLSAFTHRTPSGGGFVNNAQCSAFVTCLIDETQNNSTAYQFIAGLGYDVNESLVWDTQYRYMNTGEFTFGGRGGNSHAAVLPGGRGAIISTETESAGAHVIMTGFRYRFGGNKVKTTKYRTEYVAPVATMYACADGSQASSLASCEVTCWDGSSAASEAACPVQVQCWDGSLVSDRAACSLPPAPPVAVTQYDPCAIGATSFVVYFPWDKSTLTEQAKNVIVDASNTAKLCNISNLVIEGHADSSGAAGYNVGLSNRRTKTVETELKANGVNTSNVVKSAKGETALALSTGDGVREPLNRRTEVVIQLIPGTYLTQ